MRRFFLVLIPLALIAVGVLWPVVFRPSSEASAADDPVVFSNYDVDLIVSAGGRLDAVETITAEFPSGRHGLFKYWDVDNQNDPGVRQTPEVTSILLDGQPVPYQMLWEGGERFRVAKIGDPDEYLSYGTHVFEIRYNIDGVLDPGATGADKTVRRLDRRNQPNRRPSSTGTSSHRRGTTRSNGPTSRSPCPATSAARSARSASASVGPAMT